MKIGRVEKVSAVKVLYKDNQVKRGPAHDPDATITPSAPEAEKAILGSIILCNEQLCEVSDKISVTDFFSGANQIIYRRMLEIQESNRPIDSVILLSELSKHGDLEVAGGVGYLSQLADDIPRATNVVQYAKIVKAKAVMRALIDEAEDIKRRAAEGIEEPWQICERSAQKMAVLAGEEGRASIATRYDASIQLLTQLDDKEDSKIISGIPKLDELLGGYLPGELVVYAADPGVGKTYMALQTAKNACLAGCHGLFCSGEMLASHLMARELCGATGVESVRMRRRSLLTQADMRLLRDAAEQECRECEILGGGLTLPAINAAVRSLADRGKLKFLIVDYDELVEVYGGEGKWDKQDILFKHLKNGIAMRYKIPVICVSQMRKELSEDDVRKPRLQSLFGSGAKGKDPSIVIFVDRPFVRNLEGTETEAKIFVLKSRDGKQGFVDCLFDIKTFRFREPTEMEWAQMATQKASKKKSHGKQS